MMKGISTALGNVGCGHAVRWASVSGGYGKCHGSPCTVVKDKDSCKNAKCLIIISVGVKSQSLSWSCDAAQSTCSTLVCGDDLLRYLKIDLRFWVFFSFLDL